VNTDPGAYFSGALLDAPCMWLLSLTYNKFDVAEKFIATNTLAFLLEWVLLAFLGGTTNIFITLTFVKTLATSADLRMLKLLFEFKKHILYSLKTRQLL